MIPAAANDETGTAPILRLHCEVPNCRRTRGPRTGDRAKIVAWVCADHWRAVPKAVRDAYAKAKRGLGSYGPDFWWEQCVRSAIWNGTRPASDFVLLRDPEPAPSDADPHTLNPKAIGQAADLRG